MDADNLLTFSTIILGIFTVILQVQSSEKNIWEPWRIWIIDYSNYINSFIFNQVTSYLLLAGTIAYMTISGIWGGFAMIVAAMTAQKKQ